MHPKFWNVNATIIFYSYTCSTIQNGAVALGRASMNGHQEVVDVLLSARANPDVQEEVIGMVYSSDSRRWYMYVL